ncbi:MAG: YceI family protein [Gammaproteobacteria bacterium]|nr:YceI family protein [Gammaproteobacteria bacterium]MDH5693417.1 YceI family protein [Gammaproteobacteria bacterium]
MKKVFLAGLFVTLPIAASAETYTIDPAHTYPNFEISHLGFSTMHGRFNSTKGKIEMELGKSGSVDIVIDASSIDTAFKKRDEHLRSPDFLNTAEFPEITYKSTSVKFKGDSKATVEGNLTIMGVSKPVTLNVTSITCGNHPFNKKPMCGFDAEATIKRSDWGVKYGLPAIGDEMKIHLEAEAVKE